MISLLLQRCYTFTFKGREASTARADVRSAAAKLGLSLGEFIAPDRTRRVEEDIIQKLGLPAEERLLHCRWPVSCQLMDAGSRPVGLIVRFFISVQLLRRIGVSWSHAPIHHMACYYASVCSVITAKEKGAPFC